LTLDSYCGGADFSGDNIVNFYTKLGEQLGIHSQWDKILIL